MQLQAKADEEKWEREIKDKTVALQTTKRHFVAWAAWLRGSGPARVAALAGLRRARQRVKVAMVAEEAAGRLQAGAAAAAARRRLQEALRLARMKAKETYPRAEEEAVAQWVLLMLARLWWWRTARSGWSTARAEGGGTRGR
jgi:hypothetical protein